MHPPLLSPTPVIVGHRGSPMRERENTPAAFAAAAAEGATWVELDARMSADGVVMVHHDPALPDGRALVELTAAQAEAEGIHTLAAILAGLRAGMGVDLEIKCFPGEPDYDPALPVVAACGRVVRDASPRPLFVSSFNPVVLQAWSEQGHPQPTGLLTVGMRLEDCLEEAGDVGASILCPGLDSAGLDADGIAMAHGAGTQVMVWTVDDPTRARDLARAGVDALCTNDPAGIVAAVGPPAG